MNIRSATFLFSLLLSIRCVAQTPPAAEPSEGIDDVVIVNGWRHPIQLRLQMLDAERKVYDLFNQFNDEPQFAFECARRNVSGTRLQIMDCQPGFERQALTQEAQDYLAAYRAYLDAVALGGGLENGGAFANYSPPVVAVPTDPIISAKQRRLQRKMKTIAEQNPEFTEALAAYVDLKIRYNQATTRVQE